MSDDELIETGLFEEPEGFNPPPPEPHFAKYQRKNKSNPSELNLRLVGKSPLWGHLLWNAGIYTANYLDEHAEDLVTDKNVLELGAAAGLPSVICSINNCNKMVSTDYPDPELLTNIQYNFDHCEGVDASKSIVRGYIWGNDVKPLMVDDESAEVSEEDKFDLVILSDLVFNHTEHLKLLKACRDSMKKTGKGLVVFSPHRAHLLHMDLEFFKTCEDFQFKAEKIDMVTWKPMFEEDEETVDIRSRVYAYFIHPQW